MKKIGFVARGLTNNGVKQFILNVLNHWDKSTDGKNVIVFTDELSFKDDYKNLQIIHIPKTNKLIWDNILFPIEAYKYALHSVIYTKNAIPPTNLILNLKKIIMIYDLGYFYPELKAYKFWDTIYMKLFLTISKHFFDKVLTISEFSKSEIIKILQIPSKKIFVTYLGVDKKFSDVTGKDETTAILEKHSIQKPYFFYVGSLSPRKNILKSLIAFNSIKNKIPQNFYIVSSRSWGDNEESEYIRQKKLENRVKIITGVSDADLVTIYQNASALVYPSLYEGFGLPIIEALASKCPVITSNTSSCVEIGAEFAYLVNPQDTEQLANAMMNVSGNREEYVSDKELRSKLLDTFDWDKTAKQIYKIAQM